MARLSDESSNPNAADLDLDGVTNLDRDATADYKPDAEGSNPNDADFDRGATTEFDRGAITNFDRDAITNHDRGALTEFDRGALTEFDRNGTADPDPDATDGGVHSPGVAAANTEDATQPTGGRRRGELPRVDGYEILKVLGAGGMGIVYKARHLRLDRVVALKMIRAGTGALPEELTRFEAEARAVAAIDHPNIIKIFEIGERDGLPYVSLEFLEGASLAQQIAGKPQPVDDAARIAETLARAMDVAHRRGIVHRDIKPANVLLAGDGTPKIADFGLVKRLETDSAQTGTGSILGSPSYMAPEQATGAEKAGPAADQYALGATLYEMLTGRPPFRGSSFLETLDLVRTAEPVAPSQLLPHMPRDLETICLKALQKDPARRYPGVAAMAEDLRRFRAGEPIVARPISGPERAWRWCRRNPTVAVLLGAVAASLLLGMAGTSYYAIQAGNREQDAQANARKAREEKERSELRWYAAESTLAQKDWQEGELASLERRLDLLKLREPGAPDLRGFEWHYLKRLCRLDMSTLPGHSAPVRCVAFSPDGKLLASASGNFGRPGEVKVWDVATGQERLCLGGHKDLVSCVAFSPDGRRLVSANGGVQTPGEIKVWDAVNGRELASLPAHATPVRGLAFSPDGQNLATFAGGVNPGGLLLPGEVKVWDPVTRKQRLSIPGNEAADWIGASSMVAFSPTAAERPRQLAFADGRSIRVCDPATGKELLRLGKHAYLVNSVAYSPDGRRLASGSSNGSVKVWDVDTRAEILEFHYTYGIAGLAFSPDGRRLAAAAGNNIVKVWDLTTEDEALVLHGHTDTVASVSFSPDGWRLASGGGDGTVKLWDASAATEAVSLRGVFSNVADMAFDTDGRRVAIASGPVSRVLDTATGAQVFPLIGHAASVLGVAYSPDGRQLASAGEDRTVRVWDATNGSEMFCLRGHTAPIRAVAFSPDGRRLASISRGAVGKGRPAAGEIMIWDSNKGQQVLTLSGRTELDANPWLAGVTFSPSGDRLATSDGETVRIWNVDTGLEIRTLRSPEGLVTRMAYSPDGSRLAAASQNGSVIVWDTIAGKTCLTLRGRTGIVHGVAYSPDGRRLVTAAGGMNKGGEQLYGDVKLWDARNGQEILTLRGPLAQHPRVAFDGGGRRLAVSGDREVMIWDGFPLDAELAIERQAASLVNFLLTQLQTPEAVSARVRDYAVSDSVRQRALTLIEPVWRSQVSEVAEQTVRSLIYKALLRSEIVAQLCADPALSEPVRQAALALAERFEESPFYLDRASRAVSSRPGAGAAAYRRAIQQAEIACRLIPFEGSYHTTLGMAQYRLGRYQEALATLTRADELNQAAQGEHAPEDQALLAMARYQMGEKDQALACLNRLRETMRKPQSVRGKEVQSLLNEAEALLAERALQPEK
jgi:WD40 repeat protein